MAKTKFVFDNATGTLRPEEQATPKQVMPVESIETKKNDDGVEEVSVNLKTPKPNVNMNEPIIQFRQNSDYTLFQVIEERSKKPMMIIGGYGLEIKFNMAELRSTERIEQLLNGLSTMFRKMILEQALSKPKQ